MGATDTLRSVRISLLIWNVNFLEEQGMETRIFIWRNLKLLMILNRKWIVPSTLQLHITSGSVQVLRAKKLTTVILLLDEKLEVPAEDYRATFRVFQVKMNNRSLIDTTGVTYEEGSREEQVRKIPKILRNPERKSQREVKVAGEWIVRQVEWKRCPWPQGRACEGERKWRMKRRRVREKVIQQ